MTGLSPLRVVATGLVDLGGGLVVEGVVVEDGTAIFLTSQVQRVLGVAKQRDLDRQIKRIPREGGPLSVSPRLVQLDKGVTIRRLAVATPTPAIRPDASTPSHPFPASSLSPVARFVARGAHARPAPDPRHRRNHANHV